MADYVNQGPDKRAGGAIGEVLAATQRALSYRSPSPSTVLAKIPLSDGGHIAIAWPPFLSIFVSKGNGRYQSFRAGWRYDANWGDGNHPTEPAHDPPGGYIADVIIKGDIDKVVEP